MKIYIAGPLFNEIELKRNKEVKDKFVKEGFDTYLPQEEAGKFWEIDAENKNKSTEEKKKKIFEKDIEAIKNCDVIICILDGRVPDEGMCVELGMAYSFGKRCVGYKTDVRKMSEFGENIMIWGSLEKIFPSLDELVTWLKGKI